MNDAGLMGLQSPSDQEIRRDDLRNLTRVAAAGELRDGDRDRADLSTPISTSTCAAALWGRRQRPRGSPPWKRKSRPPHGALLSWPPVRRPSRKTTGVLIARRDGRLKPGHDSGKEGSCQPPYMSRGLKRRTMSRQVSYCCGIMDTGRPRIAARIAASAMAWRSVTWMHPSRLAAARRAVPVQLDPKTHDGGFGGFAPMGRSQFCSMRLWTRSAHVPGHSSRLVPAASPWPDPEASCRMPGLVRGSVSPDGAPAFGSRVQHSRLAVRIDL